MSAPDEPWAYRPPLDTLAADGGAYHDGEGWVLDRWPLLWRYEKHGGVYTLDLTGPEWDRSALVEAAPGLWTGALTLLVRS